MTQADTQLETARTTSSRGVSLVVVIVMLALGVWLWRVHGRRPGKLTGLASLHRIGRCPPSQAPVSLFIGLNDYLLSAASS